MHNCPSLTCACHSRRYVSHGLGSGTNGPSHCAARRGHRTDPGVATLKLSSQCLRESESQASSPGCRARGGRGPAAGCTEPLRWRRGAPHRPPPAPAAPGQQNPGEASSHSEISFLPGYQARYPRKSASVQKIRNRDSSFS